MRQARDVELTAAKIRLVAEEPQGAPIAIIEFKLQAPPVFGGGGVDLARQADPPVAIDIGIGDQ